MSFPTPPPSIGVILCSTRQPRVCPQIGAFVTSTIESRLSSLPTSPSSTPTPQPTLHLIDLLTWNLPLFNEPAIPSQITTHTAYTHPHTQAFSLEIQSHAAFIFILPQYNWGYPACIKNAIDYLYHEWANKPALIVSYGGHGGGKAAAQLRQVLQGVRMRVAETMPALTFPGREVVGRASRGEDILSLTQEGGGGIWEGREREEVWRGWGELVGLFGEM